uniref:TapB family protein n=1 Tax=Arhodomonas sp. SL1 TaxID=3425691 RepID=UPI003F883031
ANSDVSSDNAVEGLLRAAGALDAGDDSDDGDDGSVVGGGSATACFNPALLATGTQIFQEFSGTERETGESITFTIQQIVNGPTTFNGRTAIEVDQRVQGTDTASGMTGSGDVLSYEQVEQGRSTFRTVGTKSTFMSGGVSVINTIVNEPPSTLRFNLAPGERYTEEYTVTSSSDLGVGTPQETRSEHERTVTYLGRETVQVPAGAFEACKFRFEDQVTSFGQTTTNESLQWIAVDSGINVRVEDEGVLAELVSGRINGNAL